MNVGDKVIILPSAKLTRMKLNDLEGECGTITVVKSHGYWVCFQSLWNNEIEWFIPSESVCYNKI